MVWGTGAARRHARTPDADLAELPAVAPPTAQCAGCETWVVLATDRTLPPSWRIVNGEALCGDCAPPPDGSLRAAIGRPPAGRVERLRPVGPETPARHHGCRISHEIAFGQAAIELRPGTVTPRGRDDRIRFMMAPAGLDQLIIELDAIRVQLAGKPS